MRFSLSLLSSTALVLILRVPTAETLLSRQLFHSRYAADSRHELSRNLLQRNVIHRPVASMDDDESPVEIEQKTETEANRKESSSFSDMFTRETIVTSGTGKVADPVPDSNPVLIPVKVLSPYEEEVKKYENKLEKECEYLESALQCEKGQLALRKDSITMSGKNGFYFVQVEVSEFQKRKEAEQKARVLRNKKDFVLKMLPVVDSFRAAPAVAPAANEREESMHKNFGSLCKSIITVFEKYGFQEFDAGRAYFSRHLYQRKPLLFIYRCLQLHLCRTAFYFPSGVGSFIFSSFLNAIRRTYLSHTLFFNSATPEIGSSVMTSHHEVLELVDGDVDGVQWGGIVVSQLRPGLSDKEGEVLR